MSTTYVIAEAMGGEWNPFNKYLWETEGFAILFFPKYESKKYALLNLKGGGHYDFGTLKEAKGKAKELADKL